MDAETYICIADFKLMASQEIRCELFEFILEVFIDRIPTLKNPLKILNY